MGDEKWNQWNGNICTALEEKSYIKEKQQGRGVQLQTLFASLQQITTIYTLSKYSVDQNKITYIFCTYKLGFFVYNTLLNVNRKKQQHEKHGCTCTTIWMNG